jgi:lysozyme
MTNTDKKSSDSLRNFIKGKESLRLKAYFCPAGIPTIAWGHTATVTKQSVAKGETITKEQAEWLLNADLAFVEDLIRKRVTVPLLQHQFDALVSFVFNMNNPTATFVSAKGKCTLLYYVNQGWNEMAADEFPRWNKAPDGKGKKKELLGLTIRRNEERKIFLGEPVAAYHV